MHYEWIYEPCDPESRRDDAGTPYPHAVTGTRPGIGGLARIKGYGHTPHNARQDAETKAGQYDQQEAAGYRGMPFPPVEKYVGGRT
jgi:hypothetical protein